MQKLFNKILVPVDFSPATKGTVEKAYAIAEKYDCSIHFLNVITLSPFAVMPVAGATSFIPNYIQDEKALQLKLAELCNHIDFLSGDNMHVDFSLIYGTWNQAIIDFVNENRIDLVLIGQKVSLLKKRRMILDPDQIAEKTNIPVITIPSDRRLVKLYSIVIPITDFLPVRKLMYGVYMAMSLGATIKLLGVENAKTSKKVQYYLLKSENLIRSNCSVRVEREIIVSKNIADAVNHFASHKSADLVIVNPGTQTRMSGILSSFLGNILQKYAAPPVLTVNPV